jgi:hypothetical protein
MVRKVMGACGLGGVVGSAVALQFGIYWPLGLLIGAAVGYVTFEFRTLASGIARAWREVIGWSRLFHKTRRQWTFLLLGISAISTLVAYVIFPLTLLSGSLGTAMEYSLLMAGIGNSFVLAFFFGMDPDIDDESYTDAVYFLRRLNPVVFPFWAIFWWVYGLCIFAYRRIPTFVRSLWKATKRFGRFIARAFVYVHSDLRLLCAIDSAIGAYIGLRSGNPLIGGIAGACFGGFNYWVVSVRWLKLTPRTGEQKSV